MTSFFILATPKIDNTKVWPNSTSWRHARVHDSYRLKVTIFKTENMQLQELLNYKKHE